jgi:hypothetical protein
MQRQEMRDWESLPDAPLPVPPPAQTESSHTTVQEENSPLATGAVGAGSGVMPEPYRGSFAPEGQLSFTASRATPLTQERPGGFLGKLLDPRPLQQAAAANHSASGSLLGRVSYAATRMFLARDASGKEHLNPSLFLAALTTFALHSANRPYGAEPASAAVNDFGMSIGGEAGIRVYNELRPDIQHMVRGVTPKFVFKLEEHMVQGQGRSDFPSFPPR